MKYTLILISSFFFMQVTLSQKTDWRVGDKAEAYDMYTGKWEAVTVTISYPDRTPPQWRVMVDDKEGHTLPEFPVSADKMRLRNTRPTAGSFALNTRVDAYYADGAPHGRATVMAMTGNGNYKIHYDGCGAHFDETVDWSQLKPASTVSAASTDITSTFGKWAMFVYSYPTTITKGNDIYRQYGTGAKAPPLQINPNGTYTWYDEFNKPPVKGNWVTHAAIPGMRMGTESYNGIVLLDSHGVYWKIHMDKPGHIEARTLCSGMTQGGTKIN